MRYLAAMLHPDDPRIMDLTGRFHGQLSILLILGFFLFGGGLNGLCAQDNFKQDSLQIEALNLLAWQLKNPQPDSARIVANAAIAKSKKYQFSKGRADGLHILGMLEWSEGDMTQALTHYLEALRLRRAINDSLGLGRSYNNIGNVYFQLEQFDSAQVFYHLGLGIRQQLGDVPGLVYSYSNLGDVALAKAELHTAESYYRRGQQFALQDSVFSALAHLSGRLGRLELERGNKGAARNAWQKAVYYAERSDDRRLLAGALQEEIRLAMLNDRLDLDYHFAAAKRSLQLSNDIGAVDLQAEAAIMLAQLAVAQDDLTAAYYYQAQYRQLTEAIMQENENKAVTAIRDQFLAEQLAQDRLESERQARAELSRKNTNLFIGGLILFAVFLVVAALYSFRAYRKQSKLAGALATKNEELDARYADLQKFAEIASHDLKEPIRNIGAFANLIERRYAVRLDDDGLDYLEFILKSAHQMNALLDDLLTFSNIPRFEQIQLEPTSVSDLVGEVIAEKKKEYGAFEFTVTALPSVSANAALLKILLVQLVDNALKFNTAKLKKIEMGHSRAGYDHLFWLADNGMGIDEAFQDQIFEIFRRIEKQDQKGTGMGLAICKRIVETHHGRIWVESTPGQGSRFFFTIPSSKHLKLVATQANKEEKVLIG